MTELPEPMTPPDCDLRGYEFLPLFGHRLFGSEFYARASDAEFRAAMRLWWAAWQQCPAGSLPSDVAALALLADFGRDVKGFAKVMAAALHGFVLCSDGRYYHPLLCREAALAYERRRKERERKARLRAKDVPPQGGNPGEPVPNDAPQTSGAGPSACPAGHDAGRYAEGAGTGQDRTGQDSKEERKPSAYAAAVAAPPAVPDVRDQLWTEGLSRLRRITGKPDRAARGLLGRLCREARDDCALVAGLLFDAERDRPGDPIAWLTAAIQARTGQRDAYRKPSNMDWLIRDFMAEGNA